MAALFVGILLAGCAKQAPHQTRVFIDPALLALIPADTIVMAGARVDVIAKTPMFQKVEKAQAIQDFVAQTHIDPRTGLWNILYVSNGKRGILLGRGSFSNEVMNPDFMQGGNAKRFSYKDLSMFGDEKQSFVFFNSSTAGIGTLEALRSLIDERGSIRGLPPRFQAIMQEIPPEAQAWGAYAGGPVDLALKGNLANLDRVMRMIQSGTFFATFDTQAHITASGAANTEKDAQELSGALQTLLSLARLNGQVNTSANRVSAKLDTGF